MAYSCCSEGHLSDTLFTLPFTIHVPTLTACDGDIGDPVAIHTAAGGVQLTVAEFSVMSEKEIPLGDPTTVSGEERKTHHRERKGQ